jgi:phosphoribosylglycinamide formyltransferase 1
MSGKIRIGALISGSGTNLQAIIDACESKRIDGQVVFVGSDRDGVQGLVRAQRHNIPVFVVDYSDVIRRYKDAPGTVNLPADFDLNELRRKQNLFGPEADSQKVEAFICTRAVIEARLLEKIAPFQPDLLVLAGFMRNLSPYFIDRFNIEMDHPRVMNIHPALLPAFPGEDGYGDTFRYGCRVGGCTVHFIDYGEDSGPIIAQSCFSISDDDSLEDIKKKGLALEWRLYPECIQLFAENRLRTVLITHTLSNGGVVQRRVVKIVKPENEK